MSGSSRKPPRYCRICRQSARWCSPTVTPRKRSSSRASGAGGPPCSGRSIPDRNTSSRRTDWPRIGLSLVHRRKRRRPSYFEKWRHECELADWIVVNSDWSRESLIRAGVPRAEAEDDRSAVRTRYRSRIRTRVSAGVFGSAAVARAVRRHRVGREGRGRSAPRVRSPRRCADRVEHRWRSRAGRPRSFPAPPAHSLARPRRSQQR